jgi:glycosyltransferase involved in cell wall biosynthesis
VEHEGTGLLVELGDVDGLAQALLQLIRDPKLRQKMGEAGRAKIRDYSLDRVLDEMSAIYARYLEI